MKIVDTAEMRAAEAAAVAEGTPEIVLMKRAGAAAALLHHEVEDSDTEKDCQNNRYQ